MIIDREYYFFNLLLKTVLLYGYIDKTSQNIIKHQQNYMGLPKNIFHVCFYVILRHFQRNFSHIMACPWYVFRKRQNTQMVRGAPFLDSIR